MDNYKVGTQVNTSKYIIYCPIRSVTSTNYRITVTYQDELKEPGELPEILKLGPNLLDSSDWEKFIDEREDCIQPKKGSLRVNAYKALTPEAMTDKKESIFQLQIIDPDIIAVENYIYQNNVHDLLAFKRYDKENTTLGFAPSRVNIVRNMRHYDTELRELLNTALTVLTNDDMIKKYEFINIEKVPGRDAQKKLNNSGRTIFALTGNPTIHDYYSADNNRAGKKRASRRKH